MSQTTAANSIGANVSRGLVPAFVTAIFSSAFLLFAVQPMFTKMALPMLGGSPNVWNVAMVFFQTTLLGGYFYAHVISKHFAPRMQATIHLCVMGAGMLFLPLAISPGAAPPTDGAQAFWLIALMAGVVGVPFFALSANAPLLQRWFSNTSHPAAHDPYFLYAASNIGSVASLLLYPFLFEPLFRLSGQSRLWTIGFLLLALLIGVAAVVAAQTRSHRTSPAMEETKSAATKSSMLWWAAIAVAPSGLMLSVTTHLTTNIAPSPMLWIAPLTLYLMSFVIVFGRNGERWSNRAVAALPVAIAFAALAGAVWVEDPVAAASIPLALFFIVAVACHGELARRRPEPQRLTSFYLAMSAGGVAGGAFVALAAPLLFPGVWEYPILIVLAAFVVAACNGAVNSTENRVLAFALVAAAAFGFAGRSIPGAPEKLLLACNISIAFAAAFVAYRYRTRAIPFAAAAAGLMANALSAQTILHNNYGDLIFQDRSFFGVSKVYRANSDEGPVHVLAHGAIVHNLQLRTDDGESIPAAYYSPQGPYGQTLAAIRETKPILSVAVIGLGAGAMACHAQQKDRWTFFEIDPDVVRIARNEKLFSFISRCAPTAPIVIGDGRLNIAAETRDNAPKYDVIFVDAFSGDSIPAHLITREALALYRSRLGPGGVVFFHTSNKYLDVTSVALRIADDAGLAARVIRYEPPANRQNRLSTRAVAVVVGEEATIDLFAEGRDDWRVEEPSRFVSVWTDDYSNILGAMAAKIDGERTKRSR